MVGNLLILAGTKVSIGVSSAKEHVFKIRIQDSKKYNNPEVAFSLPVERTRSSDVVGQTGDSPAALERQRAHTEKLAKT